MFRTIVAGAALAVTLGLLIGCNRTPATTPAAATGPGEDVAHEHVDMPNKLGTEEEKKVFLTPAGLYTEADIAANGRKIPVVKYRGIKAAHDTKAKPGENICPISETKANPKFTWVIGGKTYEFCCVPCIEEFVGKAREKPAEIKPPEAYRKS